MGLGGRAHVLAQGEVDAHILVDKAHGAGHLVKVAPGFASAWFSDSTGSKDLDVASDRDWYFKTHWRKNQISDHLPIWFELKADSSDEFLTNKLAHYTS